MIRTIGVTAAFVLILPATALAQTAEAELSMTAGASTQTTTATAAQLRVFGEAADHVRFFVEGSWADQWGAHSDAFGVSYPYKGTFQAIETYAEAFMDGDGLQLGVRAGRYRTP